MSSCLIQPGLRLRQKTLKIEHGFHESFRVHTRRSLKGCGILCAECICPILKYLKVHKDKPEIDESDEKSIMFVDFKLSTAKQPHPRISLSSQTRHNRPRWTHPSISASSDRDHIPILQYLAPNS